MSAANAGAGRAMRPAACAVALWATLLAASAGCTNEGARTPDRAAGTPAAPAPATAAGPAADPALNWGGTTPHDRPPVRDPLLEQAQAAMRAADPGFDRFDTASYFTGDLDRDGRDDVVVEYGIGDEGAMRPVARSVRVLLAREGGLTLQPDQTDRFADCPAVREIRDGRLWADGLEACMLPFPKTLGYYRYEWRDGGLVRVSEEDAEERVLSRLQAMRAAVQAGKWATLERNLRPGPASAAADATPSAATDSGPVFADARRRRAFADAVGALGHLQLQRLNAHERVARLAGPAGERRLHIDTAPADGPVEVGDDTYIVDARASLEWPEGDGVGYHLRWRLIEGDLYLEEAAEHDLDGLER